MTPNWPGGPPPGWYPDPSGEKAWRWWDGYDWTAHASDPTPPGGGGPHGYGNAAAPYYGSAASTYAAGTYALPSAHERFTAEQKAGPWARRAFFGYLLVIAVVALGAWADSRMIRQTFHNLRIELRTHVAQPQVAQSSRVALLDVLGLAVEIPVYVLILRWQYKAAQTARLLRMPARRSPGLGVGSWFIPVVNLWFPYQAIRDCLPPGDPGRKVVARMWACFIAVIVMNSVTLATAWLGTPIGFAAFAVAFAFAVGFATQGARAVELIGASHGRLLNPGEWGPSAEVPPPGG